MDIIFQGITHQFDFNSKLFEDIGTVQLLLSLVNSRLIPYSSSCVDGLLVNSLGTCELRVLDSDRRSSFRDTESPCSDIVASRKPGAPAKQSLSRQCETEIRHQ